MSLPPRGTMTVEFTVLPESRGEVQVAYEHPKGHIEVLYRTRFPERVPRVLKALESAWDRGVRAAVHGWPIIQQPRGLFDGGRKQAPGLNPHEVIEMHPRLESWDCVIYQSPHPADALMVLRACRRVASIAAIWSIGLNTTRVRQWTPLKAG